MIALLAPIPISSLKPSDEEVDQARKFCRNEFADGVEFAELVEAIGNMLTDAEEAEVMRRVKDTRNRILAGKPINIVDALFIAGHVHKAFEAHVNKYAENDLDSFLMGYANGRADDLRERGVIVDCAV